MKTEKKYKTTCCYCGVGCGMIIKKDKKNHISLEGDPLHPVNKGLLCSKGINLNYTAMDKSDRLLYPEMRLSKAHPMMRTSWNDALERASSVFKSLIKKYGPDSVGFYISGQCLTEEYYVINKLVKGFIGSNNIDTNSRLCMSSAVVGYKLSLGEDSVPVCYDDIELADCFYIAGANPAWCHPIIFKRIEAVKTANPNVRIIVADPRRTETCSIADIHLQLNPGTDIVLNNSIGRILIERNNIDKNFLLNHTDGFENYKKKVFEKTIEESASICGVLISDIYKAAAYIGLSKRFISMWAMGLNQSVVGVNKNLSIINLNLITGKIGKQGSGPLSLTGQPNAMGGREVGGLSNLLSNHRNLDNEEDRKFVQNFWKSKEIQAKPGLTATEMFDELDKGKMKAIWIVCTNPVISLPDSRKVEKALSKAKFVVVQEISSRSDTLKFADIILPAAAWLEKDGTMTNSERRISYLQKITDPPGEALPDAEIIIRFAEKMGYRNSFNYKSSSEIFDEHCRLSKGTNTDISSLNYSILKDKGTVQWPFTEEGEIKRLFNNHSFFTPNRKAQIHAVSDKNFSEEITPDFPFVLTTGRVRDQWHTMTKTGKVNKLLQHVSHPYLEINPGDAEKRNINEGDLVEVTGRRGNLKLNVKISKDIKQNVLFIPIHWGKTSGSDLWRANNVTNNLIDEKSKEPDFKFSAVNIRKYSKPEEKILIIGAGAGAYAFINSYRKLNNQDEIKIFSKENYPFYNRIFLPHYINGNKKWNDLLNPYENDQRTILYRGVKINRIDKKNKKVFDSNNNSYLYDKLILCTGSKPNHLKIIPQNIEGIFTIRTRDDADSLMRSIKNDSRITIVGGGLLGLEIAGSLTEKTKNVTLIHRTSRLMEKQLDITGSSLLCQMISDLGVKILLNEEIEIVSGSKRLSGIKIKSGKYLECDILIIAVGTTPNIKIAKDASIECSRGVIVDNHLQTSEKNIFAIGEIAEFNQTIFGVTSAAEEQAAVLAKYLAGNENVFYKSSLQVNVLKVKGIELCSMGIIQTPPDNEDYEEIVFYDKAKKYYKKCIVFNDRLVGALLIGDKSEFLEFQNLIQNKIELSDKRLKLLRSSVKAEPPEGNVICSCNNVGSVNIIRKAEQGFTDIKSIMNLTGAGTGCGSCKPEIKKILRNINEIKKMEFV